MGAAWDPARPSAGRDFEASARQLLSLSRARADVFGRDLGSEPSWHLLLALYSSNEGELPATSVAKIARLPHSTAVRWLGKLERRGFLWRRVDRKDKRVVRVRITDSGRSAVSATFAAVTTASYLQQCQ
jgi:DNA-binding MarR family transcriptional regulator